MSDAPPDLVIAGCTTLVQEAEESIGFLENAAIVVRDGVIESVTAGGAVDDGGGERIDVRGQVAMPGLINYHTHSCMCGWQR